MQQWCVQEHALHIVTSAIEGRADIPSSDSMSGQLLPSCLAALSSPSKEVRQTALSLCKAAAEDASAALLCFRDSSLITADLLQAFLEAILAHATAVAADPAAIVVLLQQAHAASGKNNSASSR